jgi:hypothetical protein
MKWNLGQTIIDHLRGKRTSKHLRLLGAAFRRQAFSFDSGVKLVSAVSTMEAIITALRGQRRLAYMRFGDGDVLILNGGSDSHQKISTALIKDHRKAFSLHGPDVIKALPLHSKKFGADDNMGPGEHMWGDDFANQMLMGSFEFFIGSQIWSPVAIHYCMVHRQDLAKLFFAEIGAHEPIFVGGAHNNSIILEQLLGSRAIIKTPSRDAYSEIDRIYDETISLANARDKEFDVIVFSCGMSSRILIDRIHRLGKNIYLFDLGSIVEVFLGDSKWLWVQKSGKSLRDWQLFLRQVVDERLRLS